MDGGPPLSAAGPLARVGPNAVTQLAAAITDGPGEGAAARVFAAAGQGGLLAAPPTAMVDERVPAALLDALWRCLPVEAPALATEAGRRTADYVIAHRIPRAARLALALSH